jgi:hypothetical protein
MSARGTQEPWGDRLAEQTWAAGGSRSRAQRLLRDAGGVIRGRLGEIRRGGIRPLLEETAAQIRPATLEELRGRFPGVTDDEVAERLIRRAARTAGTVAIAIGGVAAAQEAAAAVAARKAPPAAGAGVGAVGVTALAEVLVLFVVEAKLRADLGALAGRPARSPRELAGDVLGEVQAAGGWSLLRRRSLRRALPEAAARRAAAAVSRLVPRRFARVVVPEVVAPVVGAVWASRLAAGQVRSAGEAYWLELRGPAPSTEVSWGAPEVWPQPSRAEPEATAAAEPGGDPPGAR